MNKDVIIVKNLVSETNDSLFPLITNCEDLSLVEILDKYKYQPWLEKRHEQLKTVYKIARNKERKFVEATSIVHQSACGLCLSTDKSSESKQNWNNISGANVPGFSPTVSSFVTLSFFPFF